MAMAPSSTPPSQPTPSLPAQSTLPPEKVFSIQVGTKLFRLSGASLSSDGQCQSRNAMKSAS
ncbi:hypothetical protein PHISCL_09392 [Aspergillus sclerotialis]|uniref:Uncharacterized protein n=1 Tax=Aspergillus sclerotialis TaxID=2070753 RepID=A0A3A2Z594_9EURO|nr:hypothetical protein PHISCL_09392 [Aspergillus sclerotialis]